MVCYTTSDASMFQTPAISNYMFSSTHTTIPLQVISVRQRPFIKSICNTIGPVSHINLAQNNVQLPTLLLSPYLNTDSLFIHGFPSFIQRSSSKQPSAHSL